MGLLSSRPQSHEADDNESPSYSYRFPPKSGSYFGTHFLMGGERFESPSPEAYLFGDNNDINFFGPKPVQFPYAQTQSTEPTRTLQCLVNIRRDSLKFTKVSDGSDEAGEGRSEEEKEENIRYNIEFTFDCDVPCAFTLYYFATETMRLDSSVTFTSKCPKLTSRTYQYDTGAGQVFRQREHVFQPTAHSPDLLAFHPHSSSVPLVIHCVPLNIDGSESCQSHATFGVVDQSAEGHGWVLKPLKQKQYVNGVTYLLNEIYGIENKNPSVDSDGDSKEAGSAESALDENGADCVVCMSELRDTIILPCRHLCLCNACAETLRYKASNCPICRSPFRALLQIKTLRRIRNNTSVPSLSPVSGPLSNGGNSAEADDPDASSGGGTSPTLPGFSTTRYEAITLLEALNGPMDHTQTCVALPTPKSIQSTATRSEGSSRSHQHHHHHHGSHSRGSGSNGPRAPPRNRGRRKKKRQPRPVAPIQEVLTPSSIQGSSNPRHARPRVQPSEFEMKSVPSTAAATFTVDEVDEREELVEDENAEGPSNFSCVNPVAYEDSEEEEEEEEPEDGEPRRSPTRIVIETDEDGDEEEGRVRMAQEEVMIVSGSSCGLDPDGPENSAGGETPRSNYSTTSFSSMKPLLSTPSGGDHSRDERNQSPSAVSSVQISEEC